MSRGRFRVIPDSWKVPALGLALLSVGASACKGQFSDPGGQATSSGSAGAAPGAGTAGTGSGAGTGAAGAAGSVAGPPDVGLSTAIRLNRTQYNNTVHDLLGTSLTPADAFPADETALGFDTLGGTQQQVGLAFSIAPVFELPLMFYFGMLASRGNPGRLIRIGIFIALAYYSLLTLVQVPWHIYPLQILSAAMIAVVSGIAITFFQSYIPDQPGTATNLYTTANRTGSTLGYLLFGTLSEVLGYRTVFIVCAILCAAAFLLLFLAREKHEQVVGTA